VKEQTAHGENERPQKYDYYYAVPYARNETSIPGSDTEKIATVLTCIYRNDNSY